MHHQQFDIVAFLPHNLNQGSYAIKGKTVQAPEVLHQLAVVNSGISHQQRESNHGTQTIDTARTHGFIANVRLKFDFKIFTDQSEAIKECEL